MPVACSIASGNFAGWAVAAAIVVWGARSDRRWAVPVAAMLALPALWYGGLSIMIATVPLLGARSWTDLRRVLAQGRLELRSSIVGLRTISRRGIAPRPPATTSKVD